MRTVHPLQITSTQHHQMASAATAEPQPQILNSQDVSPSTPQPIIASSSSVPSPSAPSSVNNPDPGASLQSILTTSSRPSPPRSSSANGQIPPWSVSVQPVILPSQREITQPIMSQSTGTKRKLDDADSDDPHNKIRRIVRDHVSQDPSRLIPMTTVICLHAAVAQKSYGSEKRFLCPPPVVHIDGPVWHMRSQQLSMAVISENGERSFEQKALLDNNMTASFKFLHVTGSQKAKSFQLSLDIMEPSASSDGGDTSVGRLWASFDSAPVAIISKPSKKTAKTRNISSCILAGGPVSLFNRVNAQTVRTKYMTIDNGQLCASNVSWSAFNVNVVRRPTEPPPLGGPQPVTYGCEIILSDIHTGIATASLVIRKVDKGRVSADDGGPVSQMQKVALQRVNPDGSRVYLSAAGPIPGAPSVVAPPAPGASAQAGTHALLFQSARVRDELKDGVRIISDEVEDQLCWTIVGISKFQYTFFDAFGQNNNLPEMPITPFPTLFSAPVYRPANNTLELTVSNFFYEDPTTGAQNALDVYLGNLGPLRHRVYQTSPTGPSSGLSPFVQPLGVASPLDDVGDHTSGVGTTPVSPLVPGPPRYIHSGPMHTIVIVEMPPLADVLKALEEDAIPSTKEAATAEQTAEQENVGTEDSGSRNQQPNHGNDDSVSSSSITPRNLPLLFIRASDGVGYHSGRTIACENVFQTMDLTLGPTPSSSSSGHIDTGWLAAAQVAAAATDGGLHGWTLRVM